MDDAGKILSCAIENTIDTFRKFKATVISESDRSLLNRQIEALYEIRNCLMDYGTMRYSLTSFEKLLTDPWMQDQVAFENTYSAWTEFIDFYRKELSGMTVNERLCHMGLMDDFDASLNDPSCMRTVLKAVFLSPENIEAIIESKHMPDDEKQDV
jgi:hypothetical protein